MFMHVNYSGLDLGRVTMVHTALKVAFMLIFILFIFAILFVPITLMVILEDNEGREDDRIETTISSEQSSTNMIELN